MENKATLFDGVVNRISMRESIDLTIQSMQAYGHKYKNWAIAWSGGKDSTATLTLIIYLIESGKIPAPETLNIFYADTRMEILPLYVSAWHVMEDLKHRGYNVEKVMAPIDKRFLPYILGRGVPPSNNNTFRWCTRQIKVEPMNHRIEQMREDIGEKFLTITGVRQGESAIRDNRITMSCTKDGAECGQGWYQTSLSTAATDTLAPILHWRVCHVWEWLKHWAPSDEFGDWNTSLIADAYGGDEAEENNARTGCICCPLASKDTALLNLVKRPKWAYLTPLLKLRFVYDSLRSPKNRHRQTGEQRNADGSIPKNPNRMGALTMEARKWAFDTIIGVQNEINAAADAIGAEHVDLLNQEEIEFIQQCWADGVYPNGWTGDEPLASEPFEQIFPDGSKQPLLFSLNEL